jgi:hypothetical protein
MDGTRRLGQAYSEWIRKSEGKAPNREEVEGFVKTVYRESIAAGDDLRPAHFPALIHIAAPPIFRFTVVRQDRLQPEFIYVPIEERSNGQGLNAVKTSNFMTEWNIHWEAGEARHSIEWRHVPRSLKWLQRHTDRNIYLVPRGRRHRYDGYAPLFHLIPEKILGRYGLPSIKEGLWPFFTQDHWLQYLIDDEFDERLQRAFADLVWSSIDTGSGFASFSRSDPLRLLAHNLDFWLPYSYLVAEKRLYGYSRIEFENSHEETMMNQLQEAMPKGLSLVKPRTGGYLWCGEEEAGQALKELIEVADAHGKLRAIIEAVRSNRVKDDFSNRWSYAKEDFERKLYRKRSKISVTFIELDETIPVHGPESEVEEDLLWGSFMGLLDSREKRIVILLRSGYTKLGDVAEKMGYATHSPVSKALAKIRVKAERFLA